MMRDGAPMVCGRRLLMFDFDGVIADSLDLFHEGAVRASGGEGTSPILDREVFLRVFDGNMLDGFVAAGIGRDDIPRFLDELKRGLDAAFDRLMFFSGIADAVNRLAAESPVFVITSNLTDVVSRALVSRGVAGIRDVLGSDVEPSKVKKIRRVIAGFPGHVAYYVGDTVGDMREGREAGALTVGVCWGWHDRERLMGASPDFIAGSPAELTGILRVH